MTLTDQRLARLERKTRCINCNTQFFTNLAAFPTVGKDNVLYVDESDSSIYIWDGNSYETASGGGGGISDGDKGDITVSGSGTTWTIDNLAVTNAKINDVAFSKITGTPTTLAGYGITDGIDGVGTANELAYFTDANTIDNLPVATYPSLTELSYVKGTTSAIQTQINTKANDNAVMHLTGNESATGFKTFSFIRLNSTGSTIDLLGGFGNNHFGFLTVFTPKINLEGGNASYFAINNSSLGVVATIDKSGAANFGGSSSLPVASAALEVTSTNKGFLPPRMTTAQRNAITSPATGLEIYNTTTNRKNVYNGVNWPEFLVSSAGTLTLKHNGDYVFTGTTTTWTLPVINAGLVGRDNGIWIKNRGSGAITLNTDAGANTLYTTSAVNTLTINAGEAIFLLPDGTYFNLA